jgi:hypothetical protein
VDAGLSIVIVNWNTRDLLLHCLTSIHAHASQCEVVVVDNGSTDGSAAAVQRGYPDVTTISQMENQGYARANMIGFRATSGPYVLFLNSDTVMQSDAITCLIDFLEREPQCAACGPRLVQPDGKTQPFAFGNDPKLGYLLARAFARIGIRAPFMTGNRLPCRRLTGFRARAFWFADQPLSRLEALTSGSLCTLRTMTFVSDCAERVGRLFMIHLSQLPTLAGRASPVVHIAKNTIIGASSIFTQNTIHLSTIGCSGFCSHCINGVSVKRER